VRAKHAREIRGGLYYGTNWYKQMHECPSLRDFLSECLIEWANRASYTQNRAAFHAIRNERLRRGELTP